MPERKTAWEYFLPCCDSANDSRTADLIGGYLGRHQSARLRPATSSSNYWGIRMGHFANGRRVAAARTMAGLTQVQLAELAGVHVNGIKRLERMNDLL